MPYPAPPHIEAAVDQLKQAINMVDKVEIDTLKTPWPDLEKSVVKLLKGPFRIDQPEHQVIAVGLAGIFAERLAQEHEAFWFPNRDSPEGASVGFPGALIMLSPFGAVVDSLSQANLSKLEELLKEVRRSLGQARFSPEAGLGGTPKLSPEDYQRLFDPSFIQFITLDPAKAKTAWESAPDKLVREIRDALSRATQMPAEAKQQFEGQILAALTRMDAQRPVIEQIERGPRVAELVGHLFGTVDGTGFAPEDFWGEIVLPLLFAGTPAQFPPIENDDVEAFTRGAEPLALFVDLVPYQTQAPEDGLLGAFPASGVQLPHPGFSKSATLRMIKLDREQVLKLVTAFDPAKTKDALARFTAYLEQKSGKPHPKGAAGMQMTDAALALLSDLKRAMEAAAKDKQDVCLRRVTEAEAASEGALNAVRQALRGPRIILA